MAAVKVQEACKIRLFYADYVVFNSGQGCAVRGLHVLCALRIVRNDTSEDDGFVLRGVLL